MKKFKYQVLRVYDADLSNHERELNEAGADGWELVSMVCRKDDAGDEYMLCCLKKEHVGLEQGGRAMNEVSFRHQ